jgi:RNA 3'-phosphate cyclase
MIELDGSYGEGGGSILRQALGLSIFSGKEFSIKNIRSNRDNPGLAAQHLASLNAAAGLCSAVMNGNFIGSTAVYFQPKDFHGGNVKVDIGTAGSVTLLLQSLILPAVFSKKKTTFTITGGTDVQWSAPFDYFRSVFLPHLGKYADLNATLLRRGYYPQGGGEIKVSINSRFAMGDFLKQIMVTSQNKLLQVKGVSHASADLEKAAVSERQVEGCKLRLKGLGVPLNFFNEYSNSSSTGSGMTAWAVFGNDELDFENPIILGAGSLGERGKRAEAIGIETAEALLQVIESTAPADEHLCDQLIPYLGVAGGVIKTSRITNHTLSNIYVAEQFLDVKFQIDGNIVSCSRISRDDDASSENKINEENK